jgi:hypothetical protein
MIMGTLLMLVGQLMTIAGAIGAVQALRRSSMSRWGVA